MSTPDPRSEPRSVPADPPTTEEEPTPGSQGDGAERGYTPPAETRTGPEVPER